MNNSITITIGGTNRSSFLATDITLNHGRQNLTDQLTPATINFTLVNTTKSQTFLDNFSIGQQVVVTVTCEGINAFGGNLTYRITDISGDIYSLNVTAVGEYLFQLSSLKQRTYTFSTTGSQVPHQLVGSYLTAVDSAWGTNFYTYFLATGGEVIYNGPQTWNINQEPIAYLQSIANLYSPASSFIHEDVLGIRVLGNLCCSLNFKSNYGTDYFHLYDYMVANDDGIGFSASVSPVVNYMKVGWSTTATDPNSTITLATNPYSLQNFPSTTSIGVRGFESTSISTRNFQVQQQAMSYVQNGVNGTKPFYTITLSVPALLNTISAFNFYDQLSTNNSRFQYFYGYGFPFLIENKSYAGNLDWIPRWLVLQGVTNNFTKFNHTITLYCAPIEASHDPQTYNYVLQTLTYANCDAVTYRVAQSTILGVPN